MYRNLCCPSRPTVLRLTLLLLAIVLPLCMAAELGIHYSLQGLGYSQEEGDLYYSFDILAQASEAGTGLGTGIFYLKYTSAAFGSWIHTNSNMTVTKGSLSSHPFYNYALLINDSSANVLGITFEYQGVASYGNPLPITATQLLRIKFRLQDPYQNAVIDYWPEQTGAAWQNLMEGQQYYDDNATLYSPVSAGEKIVASFQPLSQVIELKEGWNMISSRLTPLDNDLETVFSKLIQDGVLIKVQDERGNSLMQNLAGQWQNGIGDLIAKEGYHLMVNRDCRLEIKGLEIALPLTISLSRGWNIISYPYTAIRKAMEVLQPLISQGVLIKVQDERGFAISQNLQGTWVNGIGDFQTGKGYYVQVSQDCELVYSTLDGRLRATGLAQPNRTRPLNYKEEF